MGPCQTLLCIPDFLHGASLLEIHLRASITGPLSDWHFWVTEKILIHRPICTLALNLSYLFVPADCGCVFTILLLWTFQSSQAILFLKSLLYIFSDFFFNMPSSWPRLCLSSSYEVIYFPKIPFLSTSQLVLFQLIGFIPRWDFLLLHSIIFWRSYCLLDNSRNNLKPFFSLNESFIVQEMVEEHILCLALHWTSFEIPIRKATSSQSIASSIDKQPVATSPTSLPMAMNSHTSFLTSKFILYSFYQSLTFWKEHSSILIFSIQTCSMRSPSPAWKLRTADWLRE